MSLFQAILLHQRAAERELRRADLVDVVDAVGQELERLARLRLGLLEPTHAEVHLGERADDVRGLDVAAFVEQRPQGVLKVRDRFLRFPELEREPPQVVQEPTDVLAVGNVLVAGLRALGGEN